MYDTLRDFAILKIITIDNFNESCILCCSDFFVRSRIADQEIGREYDNTDLCLEGLKMSDAQSSNGGKKWENVPCWGCLREIPLLDGTMVPGVKHLETKLGRLPTEEDMRAHILCLQCEPLYRARKIELYAIAAQRVALRQIKKEREEEALRQKRLEELVALRHQRLDENVAALLGLKFVPVAAPSEETPTVVADPPNPHVPQTE
ncbi:hypothetical protein A3H10_00030 [Candidatus Uhrbacteria bacterium RIFCSPLOWO2_12_FULL_46_10]|uniref:Uncharacterized protein n=1 Tax=Candidatus Uhrbacteria bacterium RIFCSPLOWO2_01_FULL_47_25 TaxID=1802402 RepID=A0A1F7UV41_9BACT|nr:MAG: hypothetical protein UX68_C0008G0021 [Parcubacteria group bacterium GW2011_GWA2_46_9]OGL81537.1 MAG: hypothetical protein A2936_01710 [Candidatus Uhrbacteria bacterium RIFCSPLOWO2_01_FULL_47_25]OGL90693.1 MAG: hypothetical protein A3H10_00030 [Candidatus Uhrbacteria bacterium RIFCSPLOWO2_12_FULL_46_10]